jgi:hypothetical protein
MAETRQDLHFYCQQGQISSPGRYEGLYADLPTDLGELCRLIQGWWCTSSGSLRS